MPDSIDFVRCANERRGSIKIENGQKLAERLGVRFTPTIAMNGWRLSVPPDEAALTRIIEGLLSGKRIDVALKAHG